MSPSGGSTFTTSAPMSAMIWVQYGPITTAVRSTTRTPASGPLGILGRHREAVADVVAVAVGHDGKDERLGVVTDCRHVLTDLFDRPRRPIYARGFRHRSGRHPACERNEHF